MTPIDALKELVLATESTDATDDRLSKALEGARAVLAVEWVVATRKEMDRYARMDEEWRFKYRSDRLKLARSLGYYFISQSIIMEYRRLKSARLTGDVLDMGTAAILVFLKWAEEPRHPRGGYNRGPQVTLDDLSKAVTAMQKEKPHYLEVWCKRYIRRTRLACSHQHLTKRIRETLDQQAAA